MKRRVQIRRNTSDADPFKLALEQGREQGREEGREIANKRVKATDKAARADERAVHLKTIASMEEEIRNLNVELVRQRNEIERILKRQEPRARDRVEEKVRKRLQGNDTKDWIAQFGDGEEAPYVEDEGEYGRSPVRPRVRRMDD